MAKVFGVRGAKGFEEASSMLKAMSRAAKNSELKRVVADVQRKAAVRFDQVVYGRGSMYGQTLAEIFSKTRPRRKDNLGSVGGRGRGTPVKTGRLQKSLVEYQNEFAIYERNIYNNGSIKIKYGGNPINPRTGKEYFSDVEDKFQFFADGIKKFEQGQAMSRLANDLAQIFSKAMRQHFEKASRSRR